MFFGSFDKNPIIKILSLSPPKANQCCGIDCIDRLAKDWRFHSFSREELNSLFVLLQNGQTLPILKDEFDFKEEIKCENLITVFDSHDLTTTSFDILAFYILRCCITFLSNGPTSFSSSSSLKKMFLLILKVIEKTVYSDLLKQIFLVILYTAPGKIINQEILKPIVKYYELSNLPNESLTVLVYLIQTILGQNNEIDDFLFNYTSKLLKVSPKDEQIFIKEPILIAIMPLLKELNVKAISFLASIIDLYSFSDIQEFLIKIPDFLLNFSNKPFFTISHNTNNHEENKNKDNNYEPNSNENEIEINYETITSFIFQDFETEFEAIKKIQKFPLEKLDTFNFEVINDFPSFSCDISNYFPQDLIAILEDLRRITAKVNDANDFLALFFVDLIENESPKLYDLSIMCMIICDNIKLKQKIINSAIFDQRVCMYYFISENKIDEFNETLFLVQSILFQLMKNNLFLIVFQFILENHKNILVIGDIFLHLINNIPTTNDSQVGKNKEIFFLNEPNLEMKSLFRKSISHPLAKVSGEYQQLNIIKLREFKKLQNDQNINKLKMIKQELKIIEYVRSLILKFSLDLLSNSLFSQFLFEDLLFIQMLFSFLFEKKIYRIVLKSFEIACARRELNLGICFADLFSGVLLNSIIEKENIEMRMESVISLNKIIKTTPEYLNYFNSLTKPLIDSLDDLNCNENDSISFNLTKKYLKTIIEFVSLTSSINENNVKVKNYEKIMNVINKIEGDEPSNDIFLNLLSSISGEQITLLSLSNEDNNVNISSNQIMFENLPLIEIKHPNILIIFVESFIRSAKFIYILHYLKRLCSLSRENAHSCHIGKIDSFMLSIIEPLKFCNDEQNHLVIAAIQLFHSIASVSSSVDVICNFFNLFKGTKIKGINDSSQNSEINNNNYSCKKYLSIHQPMFYIVLSDLLSSENDFSSYLPLQTSNSIVQIQGLNGRTLNSTGFTVSFWFYASEIHSNTVPKIFSISDEKMKSIECYYSNQIIRIKINFKGNDFYSTSHGSILSLSNQSNEQEKEHNNTLENNELESQVISLTFTVLELNKWNSVVLSFINQNDVFEISTVVEASHSRQLYTACKPFEFSKGPLTVIFGGVSSKTMSFSNINSIANLDKSAINYIKIFHFLDIDETNDLCSKLKLRSDQLNNQSFFESKNIISVDIIKSFKNKGENLTNSDCSVSIKVDSPFSSYTAKLVGHMFSLPSSFSHIFIENNLIGLLFSLIELNNLDYCYNNGEQVPANFSIIFILILALAKKSFSIQVFLYESKGIDNISLILNNNYICDDKNNQNENVFEPTCCNSKSINFQVYQNIYSIFESVEYIPLKKEILEKLLLNIEIWIKCDDQSQSQIFRHWSRFLVIQYPNLFRELLSFKSLLRKLRIYLWFIPIEKDIICTKRADGIDVTDKRSFLLQILQFLIVAPNSSPPIKEPQSNLSKPSSLIPLFSSLSSLLNLNQTPNAPKENNNNSTVSSNQRDCYFNDDDFCLLVNHCVNCQDLKQVQDLLNFLKLLIVFPETPLRNIENLWEHVYILHKLIMKNSYFNNSISTNVNENITYTVLDIFLSLHYLGIIKDSLKPNKHASIMMDMIPMEAITNNFFVNFVPLARKYPDFLPLTFHLLMRMNESESNGNINFNISPSKAETLSNEFSMRVITSIRPSALFSSSKYWELMPILFALKFGKEKIDYIAEYIALSSENNWVSTLQTIILVSSVFNIDSEDFKSMFVEKVCENILNNSSMFHFEILHNFFDVAVFHILFREKKNGRNYNKSLLNEFMNSPYSVFIGEDEIDDNLENKKYLPEISKMLFYDELKTRFENNNIQMNSSSFYFGLRFDKNGHWLDQKLAKLMISLSLRTKVQTFHNTSAILLAFLFNENPEDKEITETINSLLEKRAVDKQFEDYLLYIISKKNEKIMNKPKITCCFDCFELFLYNFQTTKDSILNRIPKLAQKLLNQNEKSSNKNKEITQKITNEVFDSNGNFSSNKEFLAIFEFHSRIISNNVHIEKEWSILKKRMLNPKNQISNIIFSRENYLNDSNYLSKFTNSKKIQKSSIKYYLIQRRKIYLMQNQHFQHHYQNKLYCRSKTSNKIFPKYQNPKDEIKNQQNIQSGLQSMDNNFMSTTISKSSNNIIFIEENKNFSTIFEGYAAYIKDPQPNQYKLKVENNKIYLITEDNIIRKEFDSSSIEEIHLKRKGIEMYSKNRKSYYLNIVMNDPLNVLKTLKTFVSFKNTFIQTQDFGSFSFDSLGITEKWINGNLSTFSYLMLLNKNSGRTFNDLSSYPVFPLLLNDMNDKYSLRDLSSYIDVSKPVSCRDSVISYLHICEPFSSLYNEITTKNESEKIFFSLINKNSGVVELTPEFFCNYNFFMNENFVFPDWCSKNSSLALNAYEFVYENRKILENLENISDWIDLIWGIKRAKEDEILNLPSKMFSQPHPKRNIEIISHFPKTFEKKGSFGIQNGSLSPNFVMFEENTDNSIYNFICIDKNSKTVYKIWTDIEKKTIHSSDKWLNLPGTIYSSSSGCSINSVSSHIIFLVNFNSLKIFNTKTSEIKEISNLLSISTQNQLKENQINCIAFDSNIFTICGQDSSVSIYEMKENNNSFQLLNHYPVFHEEVISFDVSSSFGIISLLTKDGFLLVMSIKNGRIENSIDFNTQINQSNYQINPKNKSDLTIGNDLIPKKVMITRKWGFIIVYSESITKYDDFGQNDKNPSQGENVISSIDVFGPDGVFIRRNTFSKPIKCLTSFSSYQDFDIIVFADEKGNVFIHEAFYEMNIDVPILCMNKEIVFISIEDHNLFLFSSNGDVDVILFK